MLKIYINIILLFFVLSFSFSQKLYHAKKLFDGSEPAYNPAGKTMAINLGGNLILVNLKGRLLKTISSNWSVDPSWSPNGKKIAFASYGPKHSYPEKLTLWLSSADGTDLHKIAEPGQPYGDQCPSWSPDGSHITWTHGQRLWISDSSGNNSHPLTNPVDAEASGFFEHNAIWSTDCKTIAFLRRRDYERPPQVWLIDLITGTERRLGNLYAFYLIWSKEPNRFYYSDGSKVHKFNINNLSDSLCYKFEIADVDVQWFSISGDGKYIAYDTTAPETDPEVMIDKFVYRDD
jgi:Tol biopolymer transport system component